MRFFSFGRFVRVCALCVSAFSSFGLTTNAQSPNPRPITIDDYFAIKSVHDPQLSPDGQWVAYAVDTTSLKDDKTETRIWIVLTGGGEALPMTAEGVSSTHPRWSPDSRYLAFLSKRKGRTTQVWLLDHSHLFGGEAERITDTPQDVEDFAWSPDSRRLVVVLRDPTAEELEAAKRTKERADAGSAAGADPGSDADDDSGSDERKSKRPWVIDRLQFKEDEKGYLDRRRTHLYVFDLASRSLTQITSGDYNDSEPAWSPDSKLIAFTSNRSTPDPDATYNSDIWTVSASNADKGAHLTQVTTNPGEDKSPTWSPDGKSIAYVTSLDPKLFQYATYHLAISPASGGPAKVLTQSLDRMVSNPHFAPSGKIYVQADWDGELQLVLSEPRLEGPSPYAVVDERPLVETKIQERPLRSINGFSVGPGASGTLIIVQLTTPGRPDELFSVVDGKYTQLTHANDALFSRLQISKGEYVHFKSKDGALVSGYLYKPLTYTPGQKYPTLLVPHGGPVWAYYAEFSHLAQLYAANGYLVLFPNPRGSSGYGQDFCKAIFADWGNKDFQDDMAMVDYAIEQGLADPDKLGVGGHSYGAISTDFIIAQTTRFKAAISDAGAAEFLSLYGHDEYQRDYETELGLPWEKPEAWIKVSAFRNITKVKTPTLFIGGSSDWNVPILGGEQMYQALKRLGVSTELVVYPDEPHEFSVPSHIQDRLRRHLAWYAHYVKDDATPARPTAEPAVKPPE